MLQRNVEHILKDHYSISSRHIEESLKLLLDETSNHSLKAECLLEYESSRIKYERIGIADESRVPVIITLSLKLQAMSRLLIQKIVRELMWSEKTKVS